MITNLRMELFEALVAGNIWSNNAIRCLNKCPLYILLFIVLMGRCSIALFMYNLSIIDKLGIRSHSKADNYAGKWFADDDCCVSCSYRYLVL